MFLKFSRRMNFLGIFILFLLYLTLTASAQAVEVSTENELKTALENGGTIGITADITLTEELSVYKENVTINGNGHVLDGNGEHRVIRIENNLTGELAIVIENCVIKNGKATNEQESGGGILVYGSGAINLTVRNCRFEGNTAKTGGAINVGNNSAKVTLENCTFVNNTDTDGSGAVYDIGAITVKNCTFTGNTGGLYIDRSYVSPENANINYCTFVNNNASNGNEITYEDTLTVKNSIVYGSLSSNVILSNCLSADTTQIPSMPISDDVSFDKSGYVRHVVFRKYAQLFNAIDKGNDTSVTTDQLGNNVTSKHDIGAAEITQLQNLTVSFSSAPTTLTVTQGETATTAAYSATATATYSDSSTASLTPTLTLESSYNWITFNASTGKVTASPTASVTAGNYSVKIKASATADGVTQPAETTLTVTVTQKYTPVPKNLTFDKASITIDFDVDEGTSVSDSVNVTVKDTNGNDITALGEIVCEKTTADVDGLTSTVDGKKITFTALAEKVSGTNTALFTVFFRYNGQDYLKTSYKVELYVTRVGGYYLTLSPVEINVIPGRTASLDLKNSVKFEKVFQNNHRQTVEDAKMKFSFPSGTTSWTNCDPDSGVVTLNPGADVENGTLNYLYRVEAEYDGNSRTGIADFKVKVVKESPAITTATLPTAMTGNTYSQTLTATGETPIAWSITDGKLPDGLTLNASTGKISGTPSDSGGGKTFKFTVQASNAYGTDSREFSIEVILTKGVVPASWKYNLNPDAGHYLKSGQTFYYKRRVAKGENISYIYKEKGIPGGKYLKSVFVWDKNDGAVKEGASYIKFNLSYWGNTHDYVFYDEAAVAYVAAHNNYGSSHAPKRTITVTKNEKNTTGKISYAALEAEDGLITLADDEDGGEELSGSMYFDDGGTDEDGNITGVIGGENAKFKTLADFINSLNEEQCAKVIRIEFRKGAEVSKITAADIEKLTGLLEIAVDESETLTEFNLNGNKTIESISIFKCSALEKLDVKNCVALYHLEAAQCPKLTALDVGGCSSLEAIWLNGSSVTNLNLSGSEFANVADIDLTECNSLTKLNVDGCAALSSLYAPYTAVTELNLKNNPELTDLFLNETKVETLDLSNNSNLKSLSLVGATELKDLRLAGDVNLEEFELTGSKLTELSFAGNEKITTLNLSGNTELKTLNLTDCANLKELTLTGTAVEKLTLTGCYSLEIIRADGCEALTSLNLDKDNLNLKEISLSGAGLTALDVGSCEKLISLDVSSCEDLTSLNARGCSLKWLDVTGCAKLSELDCSENQLGWLNLDDLSALSNVNYSGQKIYGWIPDTKLKFSDYIGGNDIERVIDILAYDASNIGIKTTIEDENGIFYAVFDSVPEKVIYYYDTKFNGELMDVTLTGERSSGTGGSGGGCDLLRSEELGMRNYLIFLMFISAFALLKFRH